MLELKSMVLGVLAFAAVTAWAEEAPLSPRYPRLSHPSPELERELPILRSLDRRAVRSDVVGVIETQTPVRSQIDRGTCSIFSATALLEGELRRLDGMGPDLDLSEEWLQYIVAARHGGDGSTTVTNIRSLAAYGIPAESEMPYVGDEWDSVDTSRLSSKRCGDLRERWDLKRCLFGHWDPSFLGEQDLSRVPPEFVTARESAFAFRDQRLGQLEGVMLVPTVAEAKELLRKGVVITLDHDFYHGAWNHRYAAERGIVRDMKHWTAGIVGFPEPGSQDTRIAPAGHSVLIVGYDDEAEITVKTQMRNGRKQQYTYKGVYYFKNSWGTEGFGATFTLNGRQYPGYGMMPQKYAHELGAFYRLPIR